MKGDIVSLARAEKRAVPAFNIPYLPMMAPVAAALRDTGTRGMITVARLEWLKFKAGGPAEIRAEYRRAGDERFTWLHLDHVPVIDEDNLAVDYLPIFKEALELGYQSVMIDGSRLPLEENIAATASVVALAKPGGVFVEGELGCVSGHEEKPPDDYETMFKNRAGFTRVEEARRFVSETGADWLSAAAGNIHGAISRALKDRKKTSARLDIGRLEAIAAATGIPLVLHGGTGITREYLSRAVAVGVAKINFATEIRQAYEAGAARSAAEGRQMTYEATVRIIRGLPGRPGAAARAGLEDDEPAGH